MTSSLDATPSDQTLPPSSAPAVAGRTWPERALLALLLGQFVGVGGMFPYYAFARQDLWWLKLFALVLATLGVIAIGGVWRRARWALWAVVILVALKFVVDLFHFSLDLDRRLLPVSTLINIAIFVIALRSARPIGDQISNGQRAFFACVLALAAWVAARGLFDPAHLAATIPFDVPPLHSRFLGAMYLSGATFMLLAILARTWLEVRLVVTMVAIWTGMLGLVSLRFLSAFDWNEPQTWTWFVAYSVFPIVAAWIAWRQRGLAAGGPGLTAHHSAAPSDPAADVLEPQNPDFPRTIPRPLRTYLLAQGAAVTLLAAALLAAPDAMTALWPWKISTDLAQVYSAPFLSFGIGGLLAARAKTLVEVRIAITATLVFTSAVLAASTLHRGLFSPSAAATWLWFGSFGLATAVLLRYFVARR